MDVNAVRVGVAECHIIPNSTAGSFSEIPQPFWGISRDQVCGIPQQFWRTSRDRDSRIPQPFSWIPRDSWDSEFLRILWIERDREGSRGIVRDREGSRGIVRDRNGGIVRDSRIFGTDDKPLTRNFGNFRIGVMNEF